MPVYDFQCNGHIVESKARWGEKEIVCPKCGLIATRLAVPRHPPTVIGPTCTKLEYQRAIRD
jgi:hypothetical protein